jgi:hypothetical protein
MTVKDLKSYRTLKNFLKGNNELLLKRYKDTAAVWGAKV